jgi:hypothetical protein
LVEELPLAEVLFDCLFFGEAFLVLETTLLTLGLLTVLRHVDVAFGSEEVPTLLMINLWMRFWQWL